MTTSSNTNPISQTELEKAIERAKNHIHNNDTSQSLRDLELIVEAAEQLSALEAKCAEMEHALRCANNSFVGSPDGQKQIDKALSSTCGQNYIHKDKVREIVNVVVYISNLREDSHTLHHAQHLADEALQLAKAEGLIE